MNNKGQFSIIAALLVAVILITTVIVTYSTIRSSSVQNQPPILNAIDETNLAIKQILGFTVGYYGSVLQVTGNVSYAKTLATSYLQSGLQNIANMHPEWGTSLNLSSSALQAYWFSSTSYSSGNLTVNYDLPGLGILGVNYQTSCKLGVQTTNVTTGQACLSITQDQNQPLVTLGKQNFNFYHYNNASSTWELVNPNTEPTAYANGTYYVNVPFGINPYSYVVQVEDQRGIIAVAASFNSYTSAFTWNSTSVQAGSPQTYYVNNYNSSVDSFPDGGAHSNFAAQQKTDNAYDNLTESGSNIINAYYPSGFNLLGSTQNVSGSLTDLQSNNSVYMTFQSYQNATSTSLYSHNETATIGGLSYYLSKGTSADAAGTTLSNSTSSTGRQLMGKFVYQLTGTYSIPASTWTMYYRTWKDPPSAIAWDAAGSGNTGSGSSSSFSWSHTTGSGLNRIMVVGISIPSSSITVSNITYGGQSLTYLRRDVNSSGVNSELWYLVAPLSGTRSVTVTLSASARATGGSCTYTGVDQVSPIDANGGNTGSTSSPSGSLTVVTANSFLLGHVAIRGSSSFPYSVVSVSEGSGQTQRWDTVTTSSSSVNTRGHGSNKGAVAAGAQSMSWTLSGSAYWAVSIIALRPASSTTVAQGSIDVLIRRSDGSIRTSIGTDVAVSGGLASTPATLSATYNWASYTIVDQTDYLEIDYYLDVTSAGTGMAYLSIDNNTLALSDQTRATNIFLAGQPTSEVEFYGNSDLSSWANLTWTVDSSFTLSGLNVTFQLFNYQTGTYPTSGDGFNTTTIGTADVLVTQLITSNPTYFRNATTGYWKLKVKANASTQFNWKVDLVKYQTSYVNYQLVLEEQWTNASYTNAQLCIKTGSFSGTEALEVDAWNGSAWTSVIGSLNATSWNNVTVSAYLQSANFTIRFKDTNQTYDTVQDMWQVDAALLTVWPTADLYSLSRQGTIVVELLQDGTMRWLGQNLVLTNSNSTLPFPPVPVKSIHINETINGLNAEVPFQVEDWSSAYRVPLGLTSNMSLFSGRTMLVFLATPNASKVTIWWNGSDMATQTPLAFNDMYFTQDDTANGILSNGNLKLILPSISLYVDSFNSTFASWTPHGVPPLNDTQNNYINDNTNGHKEGWFTFQDLPTAYSQLFASSDQGIGATVSIDFDCMRDPSSDDYFQFNVSNGMTTYGPYTIVPPNGGYGWVSYDVSGIINTLRKVNGATFQVIYVLGSTASNVYISGVRLSLNFWLTSVYGNSTVRADFLRVNSQNPTYGSKPAYTIYHGIIRDVISQEAEWSGGVSNCANVYSEIVITLPANATYYSYQLRLIFVNSTQTRNVTDLCPIGLTTQLSQPQIETENGTLAGLPQNVTTTNADLFYNFSNGNWAHHWSQFILGTTGAGIMFTDSANQNLYAFDSMRHNATGSLQANSNMGTIQLLPVTTSLLNSSTALDPGIQDITWYGAVATFSATTPIYSNTDQTGLWLIVEYPPTVAVTGENYKL